MTGSFSMFAQQPGSSETHGALGPRAEMTRVHSFFSDNLERALQQGFVTGSMSRQGIGP
jgi:hypothetical protein